MRKQRKTTMQATTSSSTTSNIQKKVLTYARDIALDKLNKKLDKKIAKRQIRKQEHDDVQYQRCSQSSEFITSSSEFVSSSSDVNPLESSDTFAPSTSSMGSQNSSDDRNLIYKSGGGIGQSVTSVDSSGQDEYETADEDERLPIKKDELDTGTVGGLDLS